MPISFRKSVLFVYNALIRPRAAFEDLRRRQFILNVLLVISAGLSGIATLSSSYRWVLLGAEYRGMPPVLVGTIFLIFLLLLVASHRGKVVFSGFMLVMLYLAPVVYMATRWGTEAPQAVLVLALVIVMSSVLIGTRFSLGLTVVIMAIWMVIAYLQLRGFISPDTGWKLRPQTMYDVGVLVVTLAAIEGVAWVSNREIEKSLHRARTSEVALKQERDQLETIVEERTRALRQAEFERMSQLYRFAEFGRLTSGLFHDLVNPLTALSIDLHALRSSAGEQVTALSLHLEHALKTTSRMEEFIRAIKKQIQKQDTATPFGLHLEIQQVLDVLAHRAMRSYTQLVPDLEEIYSYGNAIQFNQIVTNLVANAIDAYDHVGIPAERRRVDIQLRREGEDAILIVRDAGTGIEPINLSKIFEPFFTTKNVDRGTGIGLSVTKRLVEQDFSGKIDVTSTPGVGTVFRVTLPLRQVPAEYVDAGARHA